MSYKLEGMTLGIVIGFMLLVFIIALFPEGSVPWNKGYKQGQIDYANEIIKVKLVPKPDGSTHWITTK